MMLGLNIHFEVHYIMLVVICDIQIDRFLHIANHRTDIRNKKTRVQV